MTELQKTEFDLLKIFVSICEELNLTYYLVCGSALGAVKYKGFIPWDDDVDVALPRPDYEVFCSEAQKLMPENVFLQNYKTDAEYPNFFGKMRNSNTTYIEKSARNINMNHGVYIDLFPLDGRPQTSKEKRRLDRKIRKLKRRISCSFEVERSTVQKIAYSFRRMLGFHKKRQKYVMMLDELLSSFPVYDSQKWCNYGNWQGEKEYADRQQYGEGEWALFEGLKVRIPQRYDDYLTQKYGDWRADLPDAQKRGHHYCDVCDLNRSYLYYLKKTAECSQEE